MITKGSWFSLKTIIFLNLLFYGCINSDDFDFNKLELEISPNIALPLVYSDIGVEKIVSQLDTHFWRFDNEKQGLIVFVYESELASQAIQDLVIIPDNNYHFTQRFLPPVSSFSGSGSFNFEFRDTIDLNLPDFQLTKLDMEGGIMNLNVRSGISVSSQNILIEFPGILDENNNILSSSLNLGRQGSAHMNFDLSNTNIDLTQDSNQPYNRIILKYRFSISGNLTPGRYIDLDINISLSDFEPEETHGYFGNQTLDIGADTTEISFFQNTGRTGTFSLPDMAATLVIKNDYGVPSNLNFANAQVTAINDQIKNITISREANVNTIPIKAASSTTQPGITSDINVDNINDIVVFKPVEMSYNVSLIINPDLSRTIRDNFFRKDDSIQVHMKIEIPLNTSVQDIGFIDTFKLDFPFQEEDVESIQNGILKVNIINGFPVALNLQGYISDDMFNIIDSLYDGDKIYKAGITDDNNIVIENISSDGDIEVDFPKLQKLLRSNYLIVQGTATTVNSSGNDISKPVKFLENYNMILKMGFFGNLNLKFSDE